MLDMLSLDEKILETEPNMTQEDAATTVIILGH